MSATASSTKVSTMLQAYSTAHKVLMGETDLSPRNPRVNAALSNLVGLNSLPYTPAETTAVMTDPGVQGRLKATWPRLSAAEGAMEIHFGTQPGKPFPYVKNYDDLVTAEIKTLNGSLPRSMKPGQSIAFVGAGALPLTAILMHEKTGLPVTCIDADLQAVEIGRKFISAKGLSNKIDYVHARGQAHDYSRHPVVIVAALVPQKKEIAALVAGNGVTREFGVRSAEGVHILLYPSVCTRLGRAVGVEFTRRMAPDPAIINTTIFASIGGGRPAETAAPRQAGECAASFAIQSGMPHRRVRGMAPGS